MRQTTATRRADTARLGIGGVLGIAGMLGIARAIGTAGAMGTAGMLGIAGQTRALPVRRQLRRGAVMMAALVCLAVAAAVFVSALRIADAQRRRLATELWEVQAAWLVESGVERAADRLASRADYRGETWTIPADLLGGPHAAAVKIKVEAVADRPKERLVRVEADYPDRPHDRARRSREAVVRLPRTKDEG